MDKQQFGVLFLVLLFGIGIGYGSIQLMNSSDDPQIVDNNDTSNNNDNNNNNIGNGTQYPVVVDIIDGDTVDVQYKNDTTETIRIFGIDTPEKTTDPSGTSEFGVRSTEAGRVCLEDYAEQATDFSEQKLLDKEVQVLNTSGDNIGDFGRKLRYLVPEGSDRQYGEMLLSNGLARVYDDQGTFKKAQKYSNVEKTAKVNQSGIWGCSAQRSGLAITEVRADGFGSDTENPTEFVEITNTRSEDVNLGEFKVSDDTEKSFALPNQTLGSRDLVQVHTCDVSDYRNAYSVVIDYCSSIWNNGDDTVYFRSDNTSISLTYR